MNSSVPVLDIIGLLHRMSLLLSISEYDMDDANRADAIAAMRNASKMIDTLKSSSAYFISHENQHTA